MGKKKDMKRRIKTLEAALAARSTPVHTRGPRSKAEAEAQGSSIWYSGGDTWTSAM